MLWTRSGYQGENEPDRKRPELGGLVPAGRAYRGPSAPSNGRGRIRAQGCV